MKVGQRENIFLVPRPLPPADPDQFAVGGGEGGKKVLNSQKVLAVREGNHGHGPPSHDRDLLGLQCLAIEGQGGPWDLRGEEKMCFSRDRKGAYRVALLQRGQWPSAVDHLARGLPN